MHYQSLGKMIDRWIEDKEFRALMRKDPQAAAEQCGVTLTPDEIDSIRKIDWNLSDADLEKRVHKLFA
jgi:hypothetical protein